jgi:hypothetical protein
MGPLVLRRRIKARQIRCSLCLHELQLRYGVPGGHLQQKNISIVHVEKVSIPWNHKGLTEVLV